MVGFSECPKYYFADIKDTVEELEKILAENNEDSNFYYRSSW